MKKKVLIFAVYYIPSFKGGGPIQSIKNLVDNLGDEIEFYIITSDRDLGDNESFSNIEINKWLQVGKAKVFYTNPADLTLKRTEKLINSINYDSLYLNSFFSYKFSILPILLNKLKRISNRPIVLAPRGEFSPGALDLKGVKKKVFINLAKVMGLYRNVTWHATAETEKKDIESLFRYRKKIKVAQNLTADYKGLNYDKELEKSQGKLKVVFVSRIHPKKNLKKAIEFLKDIDGKIDFNIYGPLEDKLYWYDCEKIIKNLPENIKVLYKGEVNHDNIIDLFKSHHIFLFPTLGENFGHVISESLIGGCPVIISDQTPWKNLEKYSAGWDINLKDEDRFTEILKYYVDLDDKTYKEISKSAFKYGKKMSNNTSDIKKYLHLFSGY
ncbi:glycosyltransferase [Peribacillus frigoritolerans]|uniref:glycosyltransferase n=1 Tax=Peribacillus frigoritolerans TaxID=450367 RepID=UPI00227E187E|nr:glycosyltransferase [Peribacillus frigoritolerans]MCY9006777.1 glycosyltransferase [Peribacillus frigoritolerans]